MVKFGSETVNKQLPETLAESWGGGGRSHLRTFDLYYRGLSIWSLPPPL